MSDWSKKAGSVRIDVTAGTAQFIKGMRRNRTAMEKFKQKVRNVARAVRNYWKAIIASTVALTASIGLAIGKMSQKAVMLERVSKNVGVAASSIEKLKSVFQRFGLEGDQVIDVLEDFNERIGDARTGGGEAKEAMEILGLSFTKASGEIKTTEELLHETSGALRRLEDRQLQATLANKLYGESGMRMVSIIRSEKGSLDQLIKRYGRYKTVTDRQISTNARLGRAVVNLKDNLIDLAERVLSELSGDLTKIVNDWNEWIDELKRSPDAMDKVANSLRKVAREMQEIMNGINSVSAALKQAVDIINNMTSIVSGWKPFPDELEQGSKSHVEDLMRQNLATQRSTQERIRQGRLKAKIDQNNMNKGIFGWAGIEGAIDYDTTISGRLNISLLKQLKDQFSEYQDEYRELVIRERNDMSNYAGSWRKGGPRPAQPVTPANAAWSANPLMGGAWGTRRSRRELLEYRGANPYGLDPQMSFGQKSSQKGLVLELLSGIDALLYKIGDVAEPTKGLDRGFISNYLKSQEMMSPSSVMGGQKYVQSLLQQQTEVTDLMAEWAGETLKERLKIAPGSIVYGNETDKLMEKYLPTEIMPGMVEWAAKTLSARAKMISPSSMVPSGPVVMPTEVLDGMAEWAGKTLEERLKITPGSFANSETDKLLEKYMPTKVLGPMVEWAGKTLEDRLKMAAPSSVMGGQAYAQGLMESRGAGGAYQGRIYAGTTDWQDISAASLRAYQKEMERTKEITDQFTSVFDKWTESVIDNFTSIKDSVKDLIDDIGKMLLKQFITRPLAEQAGGFLGAIFGGGGSNAAAVFGRGKANGGIARGMTLVGERGPELVDFSQPGMVTSNERIQAALSSGSARGVTINYNINSTDGPGVRAALAQATPGIVQMAVTQTVNDTSRYGDTQRIMRG